jgi:hypothetical protein
MENKYTLVGRTWKISRKLSQTSRGESKYSKLKNWQFNFES